MKRALYYIFLFFAIQVFSSIILTLIIQMVMDVNTADGKLVGILLPNAVSGILTICVFVKWKYWQIDTSYISSKPYATLALSIVAAITSVLPSGALSELLPEEMTEDLLGDVFELVLASPASFPILGILIPVLEEIVFRGAILSSLLKWRGDMPWRMIAVSALMFAIAHMNPAQIPHAFIIGLLLGWMYYRTRSILPSVVCHVVNNSGAFVLTAAFPELPHDAKLIDMFGGDYISMMLSVVISLLFFIPTIYILDKKFCNINALS